MSSSFILNAALRLSALAGKFVFLLVAASAMTPEEFGRIGVVLATAVLVVAIVGLEGYQTLLRRIGQGTDVEVTRGFYIRFALFGSVVSGLVAGLLFSAYGWPMRLVMLSALIVCFEHLNIEVCRMLIGEGRSTLAILAMSARTGLWAVALPLLSVVGVLSFRWSQTLVLSTWLICSIAGCFCWIPLFRLYRKISPSMRTITSIYAELVRLSFVWVLIILGWRTLENGGRLLAASFLGDAQSGRFTLLSTLASLSLVACKGIVEPMYFQRLVKLDEDEHRARFARVIVFVTLLASVVSLLMTGIYDVVAKHGIAAHEWPVVLLMICAFGFMSVSQIWHFDLYRRGKDRIILYASLCGGFGAVIVSAGAIEALGLLGISTGVLVGASIMMAVKFWGARRLARE